MTYDALTTELENIIPDKVTWRRSEWKPCGGDLCVGLRRMIGSKDPTHAQQHEQIRGPFPGVMGDPGEGLFKSWFPAKRAHSDSRSESVAIHQMAGAEPGFWWRRLSPVVVVVVVVKVVGVAAAVVAVVVVVAVVAAVAAVVLVVVVVLVAVAE